MARTSISDIVNELKSFETVLYSGDAVVQRFSVCPDQVLKCGGKGPGLRAQRIQLHGARAP